MKKLLLILLTTCLTVSLNAQTVSTKYQVIRMLEHLAAHNKKNTLLILHRKAWLNPQGFELQNYSITAEQVMIIKEVLKKDAYGNFAIRVEL